MFKSDIYAYVKQNVNADGVIMISVCRNEVKRLPNWLDHYRSLGVKSFIIIDNDSADGSIDYLKTQADVHCLSTKLSFREASFGMEWVNAARQALPDETWSLYADVDEYLYYRDSPKRQIGDLVASLDPNANGVFALMVDMYPRGSFLEAETDGSLVDTCCFFDAVYKFRQRPLKPWDQGPGELECLGGPRLRMVTSLERETKSTWINYFIRAQLSRILKATPRRWHRHIVEHYPSQPPGLNKTPLTLNRRAGVDFDYPSPHGIIDPIFAQETVVLAHFKFTADLKDKINAELHRKEHFRFGAEYMMYNKFIKDRNKLNLYSDKISQKFESSVSFDKLGFFRLTKHMNF